MIMKLSVSMWSVVHPVRSGKMDLPGFIDFAATQDVEGVELLDYFWTDKESQLPQVKKQIRDARLELAVYSVGNDFFQPDRERWETQLKDLFVGVETANQLEVGLMRVFSGNHKEGYSLEDGMDWIIEGLTAGAEYARQHGVVLALENHGLMAGRSDQVRQMIETVNSSSLRANLDTGNFLLVGQDPTDAAHELADLVALVHLKDFTKAPEGQTEHVYRGLDGVGYTGTVVGEGQVDLAKVLDILQQAGYDGWLSLEYEGGQDPLTIGVPRSLEAARQLLTMQ
jgi:sugar phosphate isomerase/epimerase